MLKRKIISMVMVWVMIISVFMSPVNFGVLADQTENLFEDLPIMVDSQAVTGDEEQAEDELVEEEAAEEELDEEAEEEVAEDEEPVSEEDGADVPAAYVGESGIMPIDETGETTVTAQYDAEGRTMLDLSLYSYTIDPTSGATQLGDDEVALETELNPKGYYLYSTAEDKTAGNTLTLNGSATDKFTKTLPIVMQDGMKLSAENVPLDFGIYADVELTLTNNTIACTGTAGTSMRKSIYSAMRARTASKLVLNINGENTVSSAQSAAILVSNGSELTINGEIDDKLTATTAVTSKAAAIGTVYGTGSNAENVDKWEFAKIEINGGQIYATGSPGIGAYNFYVTGNPALGNDKDKYGKIIINGGYIQSVNSSTLKGGTISPFAQSSTTSYTVTVNGGSVNGTILSPLYGNDDATALTLVKVSVPEELSADTVYEVPDYLNNAVKTIAKDGLLYLYLPTDATTVSVKVGEVSYNGTIEDGEATLSADENACICTPDTAQVVFDDKEVIVYSFKGVQEITLTAGFEYDEACQHQSHSPSVTYSLPADVADTMAKISGKNKLTVYKAADGEVLKITATAVVNGKTYTKTADYTVKVSDAYELDLTMGDLKISKDKIGFYKHEYPMFKTLIEEYDRDDTTSKLKIYQSTKNTTANTITVDAGVTANIVLDNVNMRMGTLTNFDGLIDLKSGATVNMELVGDNKINGHATLDSHIRNLKNATVHVVGGAKLTISGEGSLWVKGACQFPAMGGGVETPGDIIINSGYITALGGDGVTGDEALDGASAIGTSSQSTTEAKLTVNGGMLVAVHGDNMTSSKRDIKANVVINGGSIATLDDSDKISADVVFYDDNKLTGKPSNYPTNSYGDKLYSVVLSTDAANGDKWLDFGVLLDGYSEMAWHKTRTDADGKLYMYLPADDTYSELQAKFGEDNKYYRRLVVDDENANVTQMVNAPDAQIVGFAISGQLGDTQFDHTNRTITLEMPAGAELSKLEPVIKAETVNKEAAEYGPDGEKNFEFSVETPLTYWVKDDAGNTIEYKVTVSTRELGPDEKTTLNVGGGDITIDGLQSEPIIKVGSVKIKPNPNGYIITGTNENASVLIQGVNVPIVFKDLNLSCKKNNIYVVNLYVGSDQPLEIELEGVNNIKGLTTNAALRLDGNDPGLGDARFVFTGEGILNLESTGNQRAAVEGVGNDIYYVIEGGSVRHTQVSSYKPYQTTTRDGVNTYPIEIKIDDTAAANTVVKYQDNTMDAPQTYLTDSQGRIIVYRPGNAMYNCTVTYGDGDKNVCHGTASLIEDGISVKVGLAQITALYNRMPQSALGNEKWLFELTGKYLGGEIEVIATGDDGKVVYAKAKQKSETLWAAELNIPSNSEHREYTYTMSIKIDGVAQDMSKISGDKSFTMLGELRISSYNLRETGWQIGESVFGVDEDGKEYIHVTVPYDLDLETAAIGALVEPNDKDTPGVYLNPRNGMTRYFKKDNDYTLTQKISNSQLFNEGDTVTYYVTMVPQPTPVITGVKVEEVSWRGSDNLSIELTGENLESLLNACNYQKNKVDSESPKADCIVLSLNGEDYVLTPKSAKDVADGKVTIKKVVVPANKADAADPTAGMRSKNYPITITINGEEQEITSFNGQPPTEDKPVAVTVRGELEQNATVAKLHFEGLTYTEAESAEIKAERGYGFDEARILDYSDTIGDKEGRIDILVPWQTNLADLVPKITLTNSEATYSPNNAKLEITGSDPNPVSVKNTITVTAVAGNTKTYQLQVIRVATAAEKDNKVASLVYPTEQIKYTDPDKVAADNAEIKAAYGYGFNEAQINHEEGKIKVLVPWGTELTDLEPTVGLAHSKTAYDLEGTDGDGIFAAYKLTVTSVTGEDKVYDLTVTRVATKAEKDAAIHGVSLEGMSKAEISTEPDETGKLPLEIRVKRSIKLEALEPIFELGHIKASYSPTGVQDFSESKNTPIIYTVTAVDGTELQYAVTIVQQKKGGSGESLVRDETKKEMPSYINGQEDGNFHPDDVLTRSEAAAMLARVHEKFDKTESYAADYTDMAKKAWYADYVGFLSKLGVVKGNDKGEFMPESKVSRMEFAAMLARFADFAIDEDAVAKFTDIKGTWGESEIMALVDNGIIEGYEDGTFRPNNKLSRAEAVTMVNRLLKRGVTKEELAALKQVTNPFGDVDESHWAYTDIISAVTDYSIYTKSETLGAIHDEWVTVTVQDKAE